MRKRENEKQSDYIRRIVLGKLKYKTIDEDYSELSELVFGKGKQYNSSEVRKRFYGIRDYLETLGDNQSDDGYTEVLIMNDIHLPYNRDDVLTEIEKNNNVDYIIIGGDLIDCESCSFWAKWKHPNVTEELILAHKFLNEVNEIINPLKTKIICIRGNHEYRYTREIMNMKEDQLKNLLNPNLLSMLENGFKFYEDGEEITYKPIENFTYINEWYAKLFNNLIVAHPTDFSVVDGKICERAAEYFLNEGIGDKEDIIVFGHTHKHSAMNVNRRQGVYTIENSCMCKPMDYANTGKLKFTPQNYGYTVLKFKEGKKINKNDIKTVYLN